MTNVLFPVMSKEKDATGVVVTWFVESGDAVTPKTLVAEVAMDKVSADVYPETSGVITRLVEEEEAVLQGSVIAQVT